MHRRRCERLLELVFKVVVENNLRHTEIVLARRHKPLKMGAINKGINTLSNPTQGGFKRTQLRGNRNTEIPKQLLTFVIRCAQHIPVTLLRPLREQLLQDGFVFVWKILNHPSSTRPF